MRPEKDEAKAEARKCEVEVEAIFFVRPRPQCLMNHKNNIAYVIFISHIVYHKTDISQTELT